MDEKIQSKINKGYIDQTNLAKEAILTTGSSSDGFKAIADTTVNELIKALRRYASDVIKQNYTISSNNITQDMLNKAKTILDELNKYADDFSPNKWLQHISTFSSKTNVDVFNYKLEELFRTIPRKMNKVSNFILPLNLSEDKYDDEADKILERE
jgi:hypothetical protein